MFLSLTLPLTLLGQKPIVSNIKTGYWTGNLALNSTTSLPFKVSVEKNKKTYSFVIFNGEEEIRLENAFKENDSIHLSFPSFDSKLVLKIKGKKKLCGYWLNMNKGINYKIPCTLNAGYTNRFSNNKLYLSTILPSDYSGKWECAFEPETPDVYQALGVFEQDYNIITGTFLTETGDYRFLEGIVVADSLYLSCFDGSHAFLFTGKMSNGKINGKFYSGKHWETNWTAQRNENFELKNPDSLTYLVTKNPFQFDLKDLGGNDFHFPNADYTNKVTIIQIMGTWCPNCMDEARYFKELHEKYNSKGLEIISIGYEVGNDFKEHVAKISTLQKRLNLDFTFLVGGTANKDLASEHFKMLNQIISFPTAIIIGKDGEVKKIHTGFNGPGTGQYYLDYTKETDELIEFLLNQ